MAATSPWPVASAPAWPITPPRFSEPDDLIVRDLVLASWQHTGGGDAVCVLPDGCQDLIGVQLPGQAARWFVAPLADHCYPVSAAMDQRFVGYRFQPGARINLPLLLDRMTGCELEDTERQQAACHAAVVLDPQVHEALQAIAAHPTLAAAQRQLGVGERTLQRLLRSHTGRSPLYWRRLARWRAAMRALGTEQALAELAADLGYADQAHMNREFRHWLGLTPLHARHTPSLMQTALALGHG